MATEPRIAPESSPAVPASGHDSARRGCPSRPWIAFAIATATTAAPIINRKACSSTATSTANPSGVPMMPPTRIGITRARVLLGDPAAPAESLEAEVTAIASRGSMSNASSGVSATAKPNPIVPCSPVARATSTATTMNSTDAPRRCSPVARGRGQPVPSLDPARHTGERPRRRLALDRPPRT